MDCTSARLVAGEVVPENLFIRPVRLQVFELCAPFVVKHLSGIALDGDRGNIIVFDSGNSRLQVLAYHTGKFVRSYGCLGSLPGQFRGIGSISFDRDRENLYVADGDNHRVQVLRAEDFSCIRIIGSYGTGPTQFIRPYGRRCRTLFYLALNPAAWRHE